MIWNAMDRYVQSTFDLVASDFSYKSNFSTVPGGIPVDGEALASFPDSSPTDESPFPSGLLVPVRSSPFGTVDDSNINGNGVVRFLDWQLVAVRENRNDGFGAVLFKSARTNANQQYEYILAMRGTDGLDPIDWWQNFDLARQVWISHSQEILDLLNGQALGDRPADGVIHFTGQSLGGGLAQYAAYEFARQQSQLGTFDAARMTLTTFNAFGGVRGLIDLDPAFMTNRLIFSDVRTAHYVIENDIVHRLGAGNSVVLPSVGGSWHLNGRDNTYKFPFVRYENGLPASPPNNYLGIVDSHRVESGFYRGLSNQGPSFTLAAPISGINYIDSDQGQSAAAYYSRLFSTGSATTLPRARIALGFVGVMFSGESTQRREFAAAIVAAMTRSNDVEELSKSAKSLAFDVFVTSLRDLGRATSPSVASKEATAQLVRLWLRSTSLSSSEKSAVVQGVNNILKEDRRLVVASLDDDSSMAMRELRFSLLAPAAAASLSDNDLGALDGGQEFVALVTGLRRAQIDVNTVAEKLTSEQSWVRETLDYLGQAIASAVDLTAAEKQQLLGRVVSRLAAETTRVAGSDQALLGLVSNSMRDFFTNDLAVAIAKANPDNTSQETTPISFPTAATYNDARELVNAFLENFRVYGEKALSAVGNTADLIQDIRDKVKSAGQAIEIEVRRHPSHFASAGFNPDVAPTRVDVVRERGGDFYTLYLPYEAGSAGQRIGLKLVGPAADSFDVVTGSNTVALTSSGDFEAFVPQGSRQVVFSLVQSRNVDTDSELTLSAVLLDAVGNPTHGTHDEASITIAAHQESTAQITISGGAGSDAYTQSERDYVGQRVSIFGGDGADLIGGEAGEDTLDGGAGNDVILGVGGDDAITGGDGNDLITVSGEGAAHIDAGAGDDVVDALRLIDGHVLPTDGGSHFGWRGVAPDILSSLQVSPRGDPRGNRADNAADGLPYAIGLNPASFSGTSSEIGLSGGQLAVTPGGGASYSVTEGDSNNWLITYTAGAQSRTFDFSLGLIGTAQNAAGVLVDGGDGNDLVIGSMGDDVVRGGAGEDTISAHDGDDTLLGDAGSDRIFGGQGSDFLDGGAADDVLFGESGSDALYGGDGDDHLEGDSSDTPVAEQGDDYLNGEGGNDQLIGLAGSDVLIGGDGSDALFGGIGSDELVGGIGNDLLQGGEDDDRLDAGDGNDVLFGEGGNDLLSGGDGDDLFSGGEGNDLLEGGSGDDGLAGDAGDDILYGDDGADTVTGGTGTDILLGGAGNDELDGGDGNDRIEGDIGADTLRGGAGKDTYVFNRGDGVDTIDDLDTGPDASVLALGEGISRSDITFRRGSLLIDLGQGDAVHVEGFNSDDPSSTPLLERIDFADGTSMTWGDILLQGFDLPGTEASEFILGTGATDRIDALGGDDVVTALAGDDAVDAGSGNDFVFAGAGSDTVIGGAGDDYFELDAGDDVGEGGEGLDAVIGGPGNDRLEGGAGDDSLSGDEGDDVLIGGTGDDYLSGGPGDDRYVLARGDGHDTVFAGGSGNTIEIQASSVEALGPSAVTVTAGHDGSGAAVLNIDYGATTGNDTVSIQDGLSIVDAVVFTNTDTAESVSYTVEELISQAITPQVTINGTDENELLDGGFADDTLDGGAGDDKLYGWWGNDVLEGGVGADRLEGDRGDDHLYGEEGDDTLEGGTGNDELVGGIGVNVLRGGAGNDAYVMDDGAMQLIEEDAGAAIETVRLAAGRSMDDLAAYRMGEDLVLLQLSGEAAALVNGFFGPASAAKQWVLAGDLEPARDLRAFVADRLAGNTASEFDARRTAFDVGLRADLAQRGKRGEALGTLRDYHEVLPNPYIDYRFSGLTGDEMSAAGGLVLLPLSESEVSQEHTESYSITNSYPVYSTVTTPGNVYDVSAAGGVTPPYPYGSTVTNMGNGVYHIEEPATNRSVQSGTVQLTRTFNVQASEIERSFAVHHVTGSDAVERFVMVTDFDGNGNPYNSARAFRGSIQAGGGDDVILPPSFGLNDFVEYSVLQRFGRGALIDGGAGNDVIGGTNGADDILLGAGDDLIDGGGSADTYYAAVSGDGTDLLYDSAFPDQLTIEYGGEPPADTLAFAPGVTLADLRYRVVNTPEIPSRDDFHPYSGSLPPKSLRILEISWGTDSTVRVVDPRHGDGGTDSIRGLGIERYRLGDGTLLTRQEFLDQVTRIAGPNHAPVVDAPASQTVLLGQEVQASALFSVSDEDDDEVTQYELYDSTAGAGHFSVDGVEQGVNVSIPVSAAELSSTIFRASDGLGSDLVWVRANDGQAWSEWKSWTMQSSPHITNEAPVVTAQDASLLLSESAAASTLFSVSDADGDAITQYALWDDADGGGYWTLNGVQQAAKQEIAVAAVDLASAQYVAGSSGGTEQVWARASDGMAWSAWKSWNMTSAIHIPNSAPEVDAQASQTVLFGQEVQASTLFSISDADGDAITQYQFWDDTAGNGHFAVGGVEQDIDVAIDVSAAQLADTVFIGGDGIGSDLVWVRANDGQVWGNWKSWNMASAPHIPNSAPVVSAADAALLTGESAAATSLFSASDADGDAITQYELWDDINGGGYWTVNGEQQAAEHAIAVTPAELAAVQYVAGSSGGTERVWARASDGMEWGAWKPWNMTSALHIPNSAPVVAASNGTVLLGQAADAASLFAVTDTDGDAITQYEFWDSTAGAGYFAVAGVQQGVNVAVAVSASALSNTVFHASDSLGSDLVWLRANDGQVWGDWKSWTMQSSPHLTNDAPVVTAQAGGLLRNEAVAASSLFSVADADGDPILQYEFWDDVNGGGYWRVNGAQQAAAQAIGVSATDLGSAEYVGGANAATEQVWVRANDGMTWSPWQNWLMSTEGGMRRGGTGPDTLNGDADTPVLEGGAGDDTLTADAQNSLLSGNAGDDTLNGGQGNDFLAGGEGNDTIDTGGGSNIVAFNAGGGIDTVVSGAGASNTLSLGGGIGYQDLSLAKDGNDLVLNTGGNDKLVLKDWYAGKDNVLNLQVILDASAEFDANSSDPLRNRKVQDFDFRGLVDAFDQARAQSPGLTSWALTNALLQFHLSGMDDAALGGDLAYWGGRHGTLAGIGLQAALQTIGAPGFGAEAQSLRPFNGLQEGFARLS